MSAFITHGYTINRKLVQYSVYTVFH